MNTNFDNAFYENSVIKPPTYHSEQKRYVRVVVDSKDRNTALFNQPNRYDIDLPDDIDDVVSAQLLTSCIPFTGYAINQYHNNVLFTFGTTISNSTTRNDFYVAQLTPGQYTESQLATEIASKMTSVSGIPFTVIFSAATGKLSISSSQDFLLVTCNELLKPNGTLISFSDVYQNVLSTCRVLGIAPNTTISSTSASLTLPNMVNLNYFNYMVMYIKQFDLNKSSSSILNKSFAVIVNSKDSQNIIDDPEVIKIFSPIIPRLYKLSITFYDREGNPYDFNGVDHWFEIQFISHKQSRKYLHHFK